MMDVRPLRNEQDYDWAIREISHYFEVESKRGSPEGDRFEVLATLIKTYEDEHYAFSTQNSRSPKARNRVKLP